MTSIRPLLPLVSLLIFAACNAPPPRNWLCYQLDGVTEWLDLGPSRYGGEVLGADVSIDLRSEEARILVTVDNRSEQTLEVRLGPDAGGSVGPIGDVWLRPLDGGGHGGGGGVDGGDVEPAAERRELLAYSSHAAVAVAAGRGATFYLDRPLGRDAKLGQYFVFSGRFEVDGEDPITTRLPVTARLTN
ncbi:MAG: hypothetical protein AB8H80_18235 [Planctomycetota bacterium]